MRIKWYFIFFIFVPFFFCIQTIQAQEAAEESAPETETERLPESAYKMANLFEWAGKDAQAAEEYLRILINYPEEETISTKSFNNLKTIYDKFLEKRKVKETAETDMFFTRLRDVYTEHSKKGNGEKAVAALNILIKIDPSFGYYHDLGNVYLYVYNDPQNAIENYKKVLELYPEHPTVYTDIGLAYELLGDYDKAVVAYKKGEVIAPLNDWTVFGLKRVEGITLSKKEQIIKDWYFLGPLGHSELKGTVEDEIIETAGDHGDYTKENNEVLAWLRPYEYEDYGYVNLSNIFPMQTFSNAYALTCIYSPADQNVLFKVGSDDGIFIWLNGEKVLDNPVIRSSVIDDDTAEVHLNQGWNTVLLKISQDWGGWGFYFRVTDLKDRALAGLVFDPEKNNERLEKILTARQKQKNIYMAKTLFFYGVVICLVTGILIFLLLNIHNSIRIKRLQKEFIASITHDLRIPVSAIMAAAEMLLDGKVKSDEKKTTYYQMIEIEAERLNRYIDRILEFSRKDTRKKPYSFEVKPLAPIVQKAIDIYKIESVSEGLDIKLNLEGEIPAVKLDEEAIKQVIINLLSNADKYSPDDKRIEVSLKAEGDYVRIAVRDHGVGISPKNREKIFERFYRGHEAGIRKIQGIGLGLAFVRNIVTTHRGDIGVMSAPGEGSTFIIKLPVDFSKVQRKAG